MRLDDAPVSVRVRLAALWATLMSLYIYNDYFKLYTNGEIAEMTAGRMGPLGPVTDGVLLGVSVLLAIPALMIALSTLLPAPLARWMNMIVAVLYTGVEGLTFVGAYPAYQLIVGLEIAVTLGVIVIAGRWPRRTSAD